MKFLRYLFIGILFGVVMTKSEAISWYRIQEMFRFQSFHMYGIIGSALACGVLITQWIKRYKINNAQGSQIVINDKTKGWMRYFFGGTLFGLGWALTGACPGPLYVLVGNGFSIFLLVIASAIVGTFVYGLLRDYLPH